MDQNRQRIIILIKTDPSAMWDVFWAIKRLQKDATIPPMAITGSWDICVYLDAEYNTLGRIVKSIQTQKGVRQTMTFVEMIPPMGDSDTEDR